MRVTLKDVAKRAGVSVTAASFVLNGKLHEVSSETAQRVKNAIRDLNYVPDYRAKQLRSGESNLIALIVPDISNPFYTIIAEHALIKLSEKGYLLALLGYSDTKISSNQTLELLLSNIVSGSLIVSNKIGSMKDILNSSNIAPFVLLDEAVTGEEYYSVTGNNYLGGYIAAKHLYEIGHRRFACLTGPKNTPNSTNRLKGFSEYLSSKNISIDKNLILSGKYSYQSGYDRTLKLIEQIDDFTALFCLNDLIAFGAINALKDKGYNVPGDKSVFGYDNIKDHSNKLLTTIDQRMDVISDKSIDLLLKLIDNEDVKTRNYIVDPILISGETVKKRGND